MRKVQGNTDQLSTKWKTVPFDFVLNKYKRIQEVFTKVLENTGRLSTNRQLVTSCSQLWIVFRKVLKITNWYWQPSCIIQTNCEKTVCQPLEQLLANFAFGFCLEKDEYYSSLVDNWSALLYSHYNLIIFFFMQAIEYNGTVSCIVAQPVWVTRFTRISSRSIEFDSDPTSLHIATWQQSIIF